MQLDSFLLTMEFINNKQKEPMNKLLILIAFALISTANGYSQQNNNGKEEVKYVIFTSNKGGKEIGEEGIYKYTSKEKTDTHISFPIVFRFISKSRRINGAAYNNNYNFNNLSKHRKITERDKLVIKDESIEFLNSVTLIDMDELFPKMTKDEFIKVWNSLWDKNVYFIDRSEIKNRKVILYPVYVFGINLY
jgi:hypothetical protein